MAELTQQAANQLQALFGRVAALERLVGASAGFVSNRVNQAQQTFLGKPIANLEAGQSGTFTIWTRGNSAKGSESATSISVADVYVRGFDVLAPNEATGEAGDLCYIMYVDGGLEAAKAVC